jgi:hypothetical protein
MHALQRWLLLLLHACVTRCNSTDVVGCCSSREVGLLMLRSRLLLLILLKDGQLVAAINQVVNNLVNIQPHAYIH